MRIHRLASAGSALFVIAACAPAQPPAVVAPPDASAPFAEPTATATAKPEGPPDAAARVDAAPPPPGVPAVRFVGRFVDEGAGKRFAWTGSTIAARFHGTEVTLLLRDASGGPDGQGKPQRNHFTVVIDQQAPTRLSVDAQQERYALATGLAEGDHEVTITRDTEAFLGESLFLGFEFGKGGALLAPSPAPTRRLEFVGDSITCGYGVEGANETCGFSPDTENGTLTYAALTKKLLGAEGATICWSGKGLYRNNSGDMNETMPVLYGRTLPTRAASAWAFTGAAADAVVVNLSTNDFAQGAPPEQAFVAAYRAFFTSIRGRYPQAHIFATLGPMMSDAYPPNAQALTKARAYIQGAVTQANDNRIHFVEYQVQNGARDGLGCDYHPSKKTNELMANQLAAAIRAALGW